MGRFEVVEFNKKIRGTDLARPDITEQTWTVERRQSLIRQILTSLTPEDMVSGILPQQEIFKPTEEMLHRDLTPSDPKKEVLKQLFEFEGTDYFCDDPKRPLKEREHLSNDEILQYAQTHSKQLFPDIKSILGSLKDLGAYTTTKNGKFRGFRGTEWIADRIASGAEQSTQKGTLFGLRIRKQDALPPQEEVHNHSSILLVLHQVHACQLSH